MGSKTTHDAIFMANNLLWHFSLSLYNAPKVQDCCLEAQDVNNININLLLFACWLSTQKRQISDQVFQDRMIQSWQTDVTQALRLIRQNLKSHPLDEPLQAQRDTLRQAMLSLEIDTEHALQDYLFHHYEKLSKTFSDPAQEPSITHLCHINLCIFKDKDGASVLSSEAITTLSQATQDIASVVRA